MAVVPYDGIVANCAKIERPVSHVAMLKQKCTIQPFYSLSTRNSLSHYQAKKQRLRKKQH